MIASMTTLQCARILLKPQRPAGCCGAVNPARRPKKLAPVPAFGRRSTDTNFFRAALTAAAPPPKAQTPDETHDELVRGEVSFPTDNPCTQQHAPGRCMARGGGVGA